MNNQQRWFVINATQAGRAVGQVLARGDTPLAEVQDQMRARGFNHVEYMVEVGNPDITYARTSNTLIEPREVPNAQK